MRITLKKPTTDDRGTILSYENQLFIIGSNGRVHNFPSMDLFHSGGKHVSLGRMKRVPALTLHQPFAGLIVWPSKDIENRSRPMSYRGPLVIHASKGDWDFGDDIDFKDKTLEQKAFTLLTRNSNVEYSFKDFTDKVYDNNVFLKGGIVGITHVDDCVTDHHSPWFFGPYGYVLDTTKTFRLPFHSCNGQMGIWYPKYNELLLK